MQTPDFYATLARISTEQATELAAKYDWQVTPDHLRGLFGALLDHPGLPEIWEQDRDGFREQVRETTELWLCGEAFQIW